MVYIPELQIFPNKNTKNEQKTIAIAYMHRSQVL